MNPSTWRLLVQSQVTAWHKYRLKSICAWFGPYGIHMGLISADRWKGLTAPIYLYTGRLTSGTSVSYGVLMNSGVLSLTSDTRTMIGMLRFFRVARIVHEICKIYNLIGTVTTTRPLNASRRGGLRFREKLTWKTMWLRFSSSRSNGCNNCNFFSFNMNMGLPLGKTSSRAISVFGSP